MNSIVKPNVWLSGQELCDQNRKIENFEVLAKGDKLEDPDDELLEERKTGDNINNLHELLSLERVLTANGRSKGIYDSDEHRVKVTKSIGKWTGHGYMESSELYLNPHEALLFMEMNRLEVTYDDVPMSMEQAFAIFLGGSEYDLSWEEYIVYSYLVRAGYYIFLPDPEVDLEKFEESQLRNQSKKEDDMIWCVLNEKLNLPFSFDFVSSNHNLYQKTKAAMEKTVCVIRGGDSKEDDDEPPVKKFKPFDEEQERNFLDILKAESEYLIYEEIFKKFNLITRNEILNPSDEDKAWNFSFDIYYQKTTFKRTEQLANYRLLVLSPKDKFPTNAQLEVLRKSQPYQVPIIIAIVSQSIQFSICTF